jgi:sterol desaturase/sphingolipid hydroxylase (fatty acid hydroxylase superfamily)
VDQSEKPEINHSPIPIRLFDSPFLEFFTHISPIAIMVIWIPVSILFLVLAIVNGASAGAIIGGFVMGLFVWTFAEYALHRFLFHFPAKTPRTKRIFFLFHGVHHAQPQIKTRLVMPPVVSIPLAALFWVLFHLVIGLLLGATAWVNPLFSGFIAGYLLYDLGHYATHHLPMRKGYLKFIKRYHMLHHYKTPNQRYGVSSPIWDAVFGTYPQN